jgi:mycofactocin precursor
MTTETTEQVEPDVTAVAAGVAVAVAVAQAPHPDPADRLVVDDLLVEDVSIDGMCGVY